MFPRNIAQVDAATIQQLIEDKVPEGREIEYKRDLPGGSDAEKSEFLADVSSFANATGGHLVFGIDDERAGNQATGLPASAIGVECPSIGAAQLRLDHLIQNGIAPPVLGARFQWIEGFQRGPVLVMHVPQSWRPPHAVTLGSKAMKFHSRNSSGKRWLDFEELRGLFVSSELLPDRMRSFHAARIGRIVAGQAPIPFAAGGMLLLHVLPLEVFRNDRGFPLAVIEEGVSQLAVPPGYPPNSPWIPIRSLSGLTLTTWDTTPVEHYVHVFRNGCVEAAVAIPPWRDPPCITGGFLEDQILRLVPSYLSYQQRLEISPPAVLMVSLLWAKELCIIDSGGDHTHRRLHSIGQDVAVFPEIELGDPGADLQAQLKPLFDILWQASGWEGSPPRSHP